MIARRRPPARRRGAVAVLVAICLVPLVGVLAFAIDGGLLLAARRRAQTVADASAHAAACQLYSNVGSDPTGLDVPGKAKAAAKAMASANGYSNDGSTNTVTVNIPPSLTTNSNFKGKPFHAEVVVTLQQPRMFSAIFGSGTIAITTRGVARGTTASGTTPYTGASLIVLDPGAAGALSATGSGVIDAESTIQVNSSNVKAATADGAGVVRAPSIQVSGNYSATTSGRFVTTSDPSVKTAAPTLADPLGGLAAPSTTGLATQSFQSTYGAKTINPGVYSGGLSLANGMVITMNPGVYYMKGGDFSVGGGVTVIGNGVTIYTDTGTLNIQGGATVNLKPPTSGNYAGLTYFQDRNNSKALNMSGGSSSSIYGTIYAAAAAANFTGGSSNKYGSQLVVKSIGASGGTTVKLTTNTDAKLGYTASKAGSASITLVE